MAIACFVFGVHRSSLERRTLSSQTDRLHFSAFPAKLSTGKETTQPESNHPNLASICPCLVPWSNKQCFPKNSRKIVWTREIGASPHIVYLPSGNMCQTLLTFSPISDAIVRNSHTNRMAPLRRSNDDRTEPS